MKLSKFSKTPNRESCQTQKIFARQIIIKVPQRARAVTASSIQIKDRQSATGDRVAALIGSPRVKQIVCHLLLHTRFDRKETQLRHESDGDRDSNSEAGSDREWSYYVKSKAKTELNNSYNRR
jgi:hypothetical protein